MVRIPDQDSRSKSPFMSIWLHADAHGRLRDLRELYGTQSSSMSNLLWRDLMLVATGHMMYKLAILS